LSVARVLVKGGAWLERLRTAEAGSISRTQLHPHLFQDLAEAGVYALAPETHALGEGDADQAMPQLLRDLL